MTRALINTLIAIWVLLAVLTLATVTVPLVISIALNAIGSAL